MSTERTPTPPRDEFELVNRFPNEPLLRILNRKKTLYRRDDVRGAEERRADDENESKEREKRKENVVSESGGALFSVDLDINVRSLDNDAPCSAQGVRFSRPIAMTKRNPRTGKKKALDFVQRFTFENGRRRLARHGKTLFRGVVGLAPFLTSCPSSSLRQRPRPR